VFNALRLSVEVLADVAADVAADISADVAVDVAADVAADVAVDIAGRTELEAQVKIQQPEEFKVFDSLRLFIVLFLAIYCWDSLKS
jgi:hypothetical protein